MSPDGLIQGHPILIVEISFVIPVLVYLNEFHESELSDLFVNVNATLGSHGFYLMIDGLT